MTAVLTGAALSAALISAAVIVAMLPRLRRHGVLDVPVARSLHVAPTPRGGGLGIVTAVLLVPATAALVLDLEVLNPKALWSAAIVVAAFAGLGLADDLLSLRAGPRLVTQLVMSVAWATLAVAFSGRHVVWLPLIAVASVLLVNATNFMDGTNGLVSGHAVVASAWYGFVSVQHGAATAALLAAALLGGSLGFLPFNFPVARIFLGDVGSYALGAAWAVLPIWLFLLDVPIEAVFAPLLLLLSDVLVTVLRRAYHGDPVLEPHRLHVYQRLAHAGWSHPRLAMLFSGFTVIACLLSLPALMGAPRSVRFLMVIGMMILAVGYHNLTRRTGGLARWHRTREDLGL